MGRKNRMKKNRNNGTGAAAAAAATEAARLVRVAQKKETARQLVEEQERARQQIKADRFAAMEQARKRMEVEVANLAASEQLAKEHEEEYKDAAAHMTAVKASLARLEAETAKLTIIADGGLEGYTGADEDEEDDDEEEEAGIISSSISSNNGSSSTGGNIQNNTITDVETTTTTTTSIMRFTTRQLGFTKKQMQKINKKFELKGYPKSMEFAAGYKHFLEQEYDEAIASFIIGAKTIGCVACMCFYAYLQRQRGNVHLALPFYFESAIRGNVGSMNEMVNVYGIGGKAFQNFWIKIMIELGATFYTNEERLTKKKIAQSRCAYCYEGIDYDDMTSKKLCGGCRYYSFCGKDCQRKKWEAPEVGGFIGQNHMGECRQLTILKHHYRRDAKDIRESIIRGENPKEIVRLQTLRTLLGLNRPKEEYEELVVTLGDDDKNDTTKCRKRYEYLTARKDGTVWIGSTPNMM